MSTLKSNKSLEKSLSSMDSNNKKKFRNTLFGVFTGVLLMCLAAIMLFSCNMNTQVNIPEEETDWYEFLTENEFTPVGSVTWVNVPEYLKTINKLSFIEGDSNPVARVFYSTGIEEGSFTFTGDAKGTLSLYQATLNVSMTETSLRLSTSNNEILDFAVTKKQN